MRRTGATVLAGEGVSQAQLQHHGRWSSASIAQGYVAESSASREAIATSMSVTASSSAASTSSVTITSSAVVYGNVHIHGSRAPNPPISRPARFTEDDDEVLHR
jgi:hypothetical protein